MTGPDKIWIDPGAMEVVQKKHEPDYDIQYVRADLFDAKVQHVRELQGLLAAQKAKLKLFEGHLKKCHDALIHIVETAEDAI